MDIGHEEWSHATASREGGDGKAGLLLFSSRYPIGKELVSPRVSGMP